MNKAFALPASVDYATLSVSATAGEDYLPANGTLVFAPGQTSATLRIPLLDDALPESGETLEVFLRNEVNASLVGVNPAIVWIVNDDPFLLWLPLMRH